MKKKILLLLNIICIILCISGCQGQNEHDHVSIWNRGDLVFDDIEIDVKEGYFYKQHEKFTVDKNTIGITIYFCTDEVDTWDD